MFEWGDYEAKAYCALVQFGGLKATDVALKTGIPAARIYEILESLYAKGRIRRAGTRPAIYEAENPRFIIDSHRDRLDAQVNVALANAEQIWDVRAESGKAILERAYTVKSMQGIVTATRSLITNAKNSIQIVDSDIEWMRRRDIESLLRFNKPPKRLTVVSCDDSSNVLANLRSAGIACKTSKTIKVNFCIADEESMIIRLPTPDTGVFVRDRNLAEQLSNSIKTPGV